MDTALKSTGDYDLDARGMPYLINGFAEIAQQVRLCLQIKKGSFSYDRELGSELYLLKETPDRLQSRAQMLVKEAAAGIVGAEFSEIEAEFDEKNRLKLSLSLAFAGQSGHLEVTV